jgi:hypothetical protein
MSALGTLDIRPTANFLIFVRSVGRPEHGDPVSHDGAVACDQRKALRQRLADQHSVEGIIVMLRQSGDTYAMAGQDRQNAASHRVDSGIETIEWKIKPANSLFDGDFPGRDGADQYLVFGRQDCLPDARFKSQRLRRRPQEDMGVEQQVQASRPSNARSRSSGSGSSKLSAIET